MGPNGPIFFLKKVAQIFFYVAGIAYICTVIKTNAYANFKIPFPYQTR